VHVSGQKGVKATDYIKGEKPGIKSQPKEKKEKTGHVRSKKIAPYDIDEKQEQQARANRLAAIQKSNEIENPKEEEKPVEKKPVDEKEKEKEEEEVKPKEDGESCKAPVECASGGCNDGICGPPKSKFTNNVPSSSPSKVNGEDEEDTNVAAKMEDAYNSMNKLLGDGAMKSMAKETKQLVNQQKELMSTLNSMTPALNSAKETLSGLNLPNLEQMTGILKRFNK